MSDSKPEQSPQPTSGTDTDQIEADIARHRAELGRTVDELSDRLDIKKQMRHRMDQARAKAKAVQREIRQASPQEEAQMAGAIGVVLAAVVGVVLIRRGR